MAKKIAKTDLKPPARRETPKVRLTWHNGTLQIDWKGDLERIGAAIPNSEVMNGLLAQIASIGSQGKRSGELASNFVLGFVDTMHPQDLAEMMLCAQMAATHQTIMMMVRRLNHVETLQQQDAAERALNKLARTYTTQLDTLKRYRSKGQQTVRVQRVTVNDGGQAIVGNVQPKERGVDDER